MGVITAIPCRLHMCSVSQTPLFSHSLVPFPIHVPSLTIDLTIKGLCVIILSDLVYSTQSL